MRERTFRTSLAVLFGLTLAATGLWAAGGEEGAEEAPAASSREAEGPVRTGEFVTGDYLWATLGDYEQATGNTISEFDEAPMLREQVNAGELPPVEQRLPAGGDVMVVKPYEQVGQYGGILRTVTTCQACANDPYFFKKASIFRLNTAATEVLPNIAKGYAFSDDYKTLTITLRQGLKWSDGAPFTADDVLFTWNDIVLNETLTPATPSFWTPGGEVAELVKLDDYSVQLSFQVPYQLALIGLGHHEGSQKKWSAGFYNPKHYLRKWHPAYNADAEEVAKEEGYDNWSQAFNFHANTHAAQGDPDLPHAGPWLLGEINPDHGLYVRNPYYFAVDTAGNQLPYIDRIMRLIIADSEVRKLKTIAGEIDYNSYTSLEDYPLFKNNEEAGGYRVVLLKDTQGSDAIFTFNLNQVDPIKRQVFQDVRFRRALSVAIDRDEINEIVFQDTGTPRAAALHPAVSFYKPEWGERHPYARFDPDAAAALLDEMGLNERDADGFRLGPDGNKFSVMIQHTGEVPSWEAQAELVKEYWDEVGIRTNVKTTERGLYHTMIGNAETEVTIWSFSAAELEATGRMLKFWNLRLGAMSTGAAPKWEQWWNTKGDSGEEPPEEIKEYYQRLEDMMYLTSGTQEYVDHMHAIFDLHSENVYQIGTVGMMGRVIPLNKKLKNVPLEDGRLWGIWANMFTAPYLHEQWYFEQ